MYFKEVEKEEKILSLWNQEMGMIYPIPQDWFYQSIDCYKLKRIICAYDSNNNLVGFIILKFFDDDLIPDYKKMAFISLFYVAKKYRKQGIGSKLFNISEEICHNILNESSFDEMQIHIGKDIRNFFPGVATDFDNLTDVWLEKRGYQGSRYTHDLICRFNDNNNINININNINNIENNIINKNYDYVKATIDDQEEMIKMMLNNHWNRWAYEVKDYFTLGGNGDDYLLIRDPNDLNYPIIAFSRVNRAKTKIIAYNMMWKERFKSLGGIGPLGVDQKYRKHGFGNDLLQFSISSLRHDGCTEVMIDWTGLMEFY